MNATPNCAAKTSRHCWEAWCSRSCSRPIFLKPTLKHSPAAEGTERAAFRPPAFIIKHRVLKKALGQAVKWRLLPSNPLDAVDPPRVERTTMRTYDMAQTAEALAVARPTRLYVPVLLALL